MKKFPSQTIMDKMKEGAVLTHEILSDGRIRVKENGVEVDTLDPKDWMETNSALYQAIQNNKPPA